MQARGSDASHCKLIQTERVAFQPVFSLLSFTFPRAASQAALQPENLTSALAGEIFELAYRDGAVIITELFEVAFPIELQRLFLPFSAKLFG